MANFKYKDFEYDDYQESDSTKEAGQKKVDAENAYASLGDFKVSDEYNTANQKKTDASNAVTNYGDFSYANQGIYDDIINKILNREKFSYDLNGDALYQQYKDKYIQQGKMAMQDTMGQAAAMTGGYGNSYAASVGNQAYQAQLNNLNDIIPELYQMAYDKYNQEGQDLYNQYGMLSDDRNTQYGMWGDKYNRLVSDRDYYTNEANTQWSKDHTLYTDKYNQLAADRDYYTNNYNNERNFDYGKYSDGRDFAYNKYTSDKSYAYQDHRDAITDEQWQKTFDEGVRQYNESQAAKKIEDDKPPVYTYEETDATKLFKASIRTRSEFGRAGNSDKAKYGTYEDYIKGIMDKWLSEGKLTDNDVATLLSYYGL